jgi:hypothetical protein
MGFATDPSSAPVSAGAWPGAMDPGLLGAADDELVADAAGGAPRPGAGRLGVVTALQTEADCLRHLPEGRGPLIHVSGGSALRARAGAEGLREKGVVGLISFGLAIGLAPVLRPGDVVVADSVVLPSGRSIATEPAWRAALLQHLGGSGLKVRVARIAGSDELPASAIAKRSPRSPRRQGCRFWWCAPSPSRPTRCGRRSRLPRTVPTASRAASRWSAIWPSGRGRSAPRGVSPRTAGWRSMRCAGSPRSALERWRSSAAERVCGQPSGALPGSSGWYAGGCGQPSALRRSAGAPRSIPVRWRLRPTERTQYQSHQLGTLAFCGREGRAGAPRSNPVRR